MKLGYIRVSTKDQNVDRQIKKMESIGIQNRMLFIDKVSGKNFDRPEYTSMKRFLRAGDEIYIDALDRLGRDYDGIIKEWKHITRELNADIIVLENPELFNSKRFREMGDIGKLLEDQFLSLLSYAADQERKRILQRQREGIEIAKEQGKHLGRPRVTIDTFSKDQMAVLAENIEKWKMGAIKNTDFMKMLDLKKTTFYKIIKELKEFSS